MRVATDTTHLTAAPGSTAALVVDVVNNADVIDGVSARVIGLPPQLVTADPPVLPLFPDAGGRMTLSLAVPATLPAGRHPFTVEVVSHGARLPAEYVDVDLDVAPHVGLEVGPRPRVVRARRGGRFVVELRNSGNIPLECTLTAVDVDRSVSARFTPAGVRIEPGAVAPVLLQVRGPRMITGGEIERTVSLEATGAPVGLDPADPAEAPQPVTRTAAVRLQQRPLVSRGMLTALILAGIVTLWAAAFLLGVTKVFGRDAMTKQAPASFFLPRSTGAAAFAGRAAPVVADALPKDGRLTPGTGGAVSGTVIGAADRQPVGRVLVQAWRTDRDGRPELVSSAATQSDGTYALQGLFPTSYLIEFSARGFTPVWYPAAPSRSAARPVDAPALATRSGIDAVITGHPARITGVVDPGDVTRRVTSQVAARPLFGAALGQVVKRTATDAAGRYTLAGLPAPGTYQLSFTTPDYQTTTLVDTVSGGDARLEPDVVLGASPGAISGKVTEDGRPLGGVTVSTVVNGRPLVVITPSTGQVGDYVLDNLPTPGNYVLTFTSPDHGAVTRIVNLDPGQSDLHENVPLLSGTGSITGRLVDADGTGVGGADVSIGGADGAAPLHTTTLSRGVVGSFAVNGLAAPGTYALTFTRAGFAPTTVRVTLGATAFNHLVVHLVDDLGRIGGEITVKGRTGPYAGATVTATDGSQVFRTTSSGPGGSLGRGGYRLDGIPPGTYSVTVTAPGMRQQTGVVTIGAGGHQSVRLDLQLTEAGG